MKYLIFPLIGYLAGSLPFALWVTRWIVDVDVRNVGSKHVGTTNTIRHAGWGWGVLVLILDLNKGFWPTFLAVNWGSPSWAIGLTAALTVVGHCWPLFARFKGGMGLAATGGVLLAVSPLGFLIGLGVLLAFVLAFRHAARGSLLAGLATPPFLWILGMRGDILWASIATGIIISIRFTVDWNREYRELWLDRE